MLNYMKIICNRTCGLFTLNSVFALVTKNKIGEFNT